MFLHVVLETTGELSEFLKLKKSTVNMTRTGGEGHPYRHTVTVDLRGGVTHLPGPG